jgi:nitrogen-specific signal transduction histidine kinase
MGKEDKAKGQIKNLEHEITRLQKALKEKDGASSLGQRITKMDHYIKNILNKLEGGTYMVNTGLRKNKPEIYTKGWRIVETNVNKVSDLVINLLLVSNESEKDHEWCLPNDIAKDVLNLLAQRAGSHRVELDKVFEPDLGACYLSMKEVHRCLLNIGIYVLESCDTDDEEGETCSMSLKTIKAKDGIRFDIIVGGIDLPEEIRGKSIEAIEPGEGKAFGLIVARNIAEGEGGSISLETNENGFAFSLFFPNHPSE